MANDLPDDQKKWERVAKQHGVLHTNIHDLDILDSASKIKDQQFYALRVLWLPQKKLLSGSDICDGEAFRKAEGFLGNMQTWKEYLNDIEVHTGSSSLGTIHNSGTFSLVRYNQLRTFLSPLASDDYRLTNDEVASIQQKVVPSPLPVAHRTRSRQPIPALSGSPHTPTPMSRSQPEEEQLGMRQIGDALHEIDEESLLNLQGSLVPPSPESPANAAENLPSEDEQFVNTALSLVLDSITIHHPEIKKGDLNSPRWTMKRLQLKFGQWEARTDGYLRMPGISEEVRAIIEIKPYVRRRDLHGVQKQESAQMAAWIYQSGDKQFSGLEKKGPCFRRLIISQDSHEIYLTVAEYDSAYVKYLRGNKEATLGTPSLMKMKQYGPWFTKNHKHMGYLGVLMLAFTLQQFPKDSTPEDPFTQP